MITDKELLENWPSRSDMDINDKKVWFARQVIRMAQEVRPLPFTKEHGVYFLNTDFGQCHVAHSNGDWKWYALFMSNDFPYERTSYKGFETEAEAIAAAQADFNRRVLQNLVHGGVE